MSFFVIRAYLNIFVTKTIINSIMIPRFVVIFLSIVLSIGAYAQNEKDTPRNGEGITVFLKRNKRSGTVYYNQFIQLNKGKFGKGNTLRKGVVYILPPLTGKGKQTESYSDKSSEIKRKNKLFGIKYEDYTIKSDKLKGACFYLSSGHGGPDPGAMGNVNGRIINEDEYAYDIILRLARCLLEEGATVHIIIQDAKDGIRDDKFLANSNRETCMGDPIPLNQLERLKQRSDKINDLSRKDKSNYKRSLFLHLDSRENKQRQIDVYFYHADKSPEGKRLGNTMRDTFDDRYNTHQPNRGYTGTVGARDLYVLNNTFPVGLYAELGNIQNNFDQRRFLEPANRQALAGWMCMGFIKDYENWKTRR